MKKILLALLVALILAEGFVAVKMKTNPDFWPNDNQTDQGERR